MAAGQSRPMVKTDIDVLVISLVLLIRGKALKADNFLLSKKKETAHNYKNLKLTEREQISEQLARHEARQK